ncbi:ABC transporter ATP-binding protein [Bifidobacterium pseudolongum]|uniref:Lipoprotein-releasing system ATP-binding protein LolD n=1 Tax=Bifidobacterium pseudolongum subsp. globosum TaxID=1690 RepID=A0AB37X7A3_9BIFI|nr:ATP-binding cassette domain-containing protein [Bifidobacterium pseudolongum]RYQ39817.1 lipoprotein-releasing system ATP-binding protein LolD [Bifidobacterium pseudolongum subsp. globosum]
MSEPDANPPAPTVLAQLQGITRTFGTTRALQGASFTVRAGDAIAITGASGSGKSTLLSIMGLLDTATDGSYMLCGEDVSRSSASHRSRLRREYIGFVFQSFHLIEHLTVEENVLYGLSIRRRFGDDAQQLARRALGTVGLQGKAQSQPADLSGGERQRVAIARAVAAPPKLLLCDEPTGNLDSRNSSLVIELLCGLVSPSSALVIVTHDSDVASACMRQLHVADGVVTEDGRGAR